MNQNSFITNYDTLLDNIINNILPKSVSTDILVGYFYFSGYQELYKNLKDKQVRILVGLDIDSKFKNIREVDIFTRDGFSRSQIRDDYYAQLLHLCNNSDFIDKEERLKAFSDFCEKIQNGTLEVRKTEQPCHAKLYIFKYNDDCNEKGEQPGTIITGSSNLSRFGLADQIEINKRITDKTHYADSETIFNALWETSIDVLSKKTFEDFKKKVLNKTWFDKIYSPYHIFLRVLNEYFTIPAPENLLTPYDITNGKYSNLKYQYDAVSMAINALNNHNGAIIADVVGLGKSIIASTVARNVKKRTIIVCPPHLIRQWSDYRDDFGFTARIISCGAIEEALNIYLERENEQHLIIIDEAHRFRNEYTKDYAMLHNLCSGNKVLLLTATPFNNRPEDIYSLIKLFQIPSKSTLKTVTNLGHTFRSLISEYKKLDEKRKKKKIDKIGLDTEAKHIANKIRSVISPLVIRRSRIDLNEIPEYAEDLKKQQFQIITPEDPEQLEYDLLDLKDLYKSTLDKISDKTGVNKGATFKAARYSPMQYVEAKYQKELSEKLKEEYDVDYNMLVGRQMNVADFMRRMLVSRFESSLKAFECSLTSMIKSAQTILVWVDKVKKVPVFKKGNIPNPYELYEGSDDLIEITETFEKYKERGFFDIDIQYLRDDFVKDVKSDIKLLESIKQDWFNKSIKDYKLNSFIEILKNKIKKEPERKIVVFSGYADTVDYLGKELTDAGLNVFSYTSKNASKDNKELIRLNFDAGISKTFQKNDFDILVATDAISEGYNLHRAGMIINYDIPYNPTRVIQRIGRINRVNRKVFDKLYIYNYFPTSIGEEDVKAKEISTLKMAMIHAIMGEDTKVLTSDEEVQSFFVAKYREAMSNQESESWDVKYRKLLNEAKGTEDYRRALNLPYRARTARKGDVKGVVIFGKKGNDYVFKMSDGENIKQLTSEEALDLFSAVSTESGVKLSKDFYRKYNHVKEHLFSSEDKAVKEKDLLNAVNKLKVIYKNDILPKDYVKDLIKATSKDCLSGYELRVINQLKPEEYKELENKITSDYIKRIFDTRKKIDEGEEILILSEEII